MTTATKKNVKATVAKPEAVKATKKGDKPDLRSKGVRPTVEILPETAAARTKLREEIASTKASTKRAKEEIAKVGAVEHVTPGKKAKPYPSGSTVVTSGKRDIPIKSNVAVVLSVLQGAGPDVPLGKKDLMRIIGKAFSGAPGVNSKEGISSGANGNYNGSVEYLQSLGFCRRVDASTVIEGGRGKVALLTKEGAAVRIPDACSVK